MSALISYMAFLKNSMITVYFYRIGYTFTYLFGVTGNTASLLTFSRPTLRKVSTGFLFMTLAISDLMFLFACLFDYIEFGWQVSLYGRIAYNELCRFRTFVVNSTQFVSAWILVIVSLDRWIRTRFPFKSTSICKPRNALIAVAIVIIISIALHSHFLRPVFGALVPELSIGACGPDFNTDRQYGNFFLYQWSSIQIFFTCLIPALLMFISFCDISIVVRSRKRTVNGTGQAWEEAANRQKILHKQMLVLILASVAIFFVANLPVAIGKIIFPQDKDLINNVVRVSTIWTGLGWFQSLNYAVNFYIHCLTSNLFRNEFKQSIKCVRRSHPTVIHVHITTKS